jgi:hypothetical protein
LIVVSSSLSANSLGQFIANGVVRNDGNQEIIYGRVIVECFNENGLVVGTGNGFVDPVILSSGMTASFRIDIKGNPQSCKTYKASAFKKE